MKLAETLKNPWVIGGGVVIAVVLLMARSGGAGNGGGSAPSYDAYLGTLAVNSQAGYAYLSKVADNSAQVAAINASKDVALHTAAYAAVNNLLQTQGIIQRDRDKVQASIFEGAIESNTLLSLDKQNNEFRLAYAGMDFANQRTLAAINSSTIEFVTKDQDFTAKKIAHYNYQAVKHASAGGSGAGGIINSIVGGIEGIGGMGTNTLLGSLLGL